MNHKEEGLNYRVELDVDGRFYGRVLQQKFSGLASLKHAYLYIAGKLAEKSKLRIEADLTRCNLIELVKELDASVGVPNKVIDFLGERVNTL